MKKIPSYKIFILLLTVLLVAGSLMWVHVAINRQAVKTVTNLSNENFNQEHYNYIFVDTFIHLLQQGYGPHIAVRTENRQLHVTLSYAGVLTKDFFNGNDKILNFDLRDFGFKIIYDKGENKIDAIFAIENGAVPVPNDVMIKLVDKNYNR